MIFTKDHAQMVLDGRKRQTRRPVKPGEYAIATGEFTGLFAPPGPILSVIGANGRLKWQVGKDYAVQVGRGKKAIGRSPRIKAIRWERLQDMTVQDLREEMGTAKDDPKRWAIYLLPNFIKLWNSLYPKRYRFEENAEVWVLVFEAKGQGEFIGFAERLGAASLDRISRREGLTYSNAERFATERGREGKTLSDLADAAAAALGLEPE